MKKDVLKKTVLEELSKIPNITYVCSKLRLSRQTVYRWKAEDRQFKQLFQNAIFLGHDSINDLAQSKLIENVKKGQQRAIEFCISRHKSTYTDFEYDSSDEKPDRVKWIIISGDKKQGTCNE